MKAGSLVGLLLGMAALASAPAAAAAPVDLASVLAAPPGGDLQAVPNGGTGSFGAQTADTIAALTDNPTGARRQLANEQFTRGYQKGWVQRATGMVWIEIAYEFQRIQGASAHLAASKSADQANPGFRGLFDTPGLSAAYGAHFTSADGFLTDAAVFTKGNLVLLVSQGSRAGVDTAQVQRQARAEFAFAPNGTLTPPAATSGAGAGTFPAALVAGVAGVLLVVLMLAGFAVVLVRRQRPTAPVLTLSSDRRYWWDGARWHDAEASAPPAATRSPDGLYWFDGVSWRMVPRPPV